MSAMILPPDFIAEIEALRQRVSVLETNGKPAFQKTITTEESRTDTAYGLMATPDRVQGVVLPTKGLVCVAYQATWKSSVGGAATAAVFLGENEIVAADENSTAVLTAPVTGTTADKFHPLASSPTGLKTTGSTDATDYAGNVATGQLVGTSASASAGFLTVFADPGTYDVSIRFRATSGSVTVKNRQLWVWTMGFFGR